MDSLSQILHTISFVALPLLLAIILHEYAHGWVANYYGDPTARLLGRLTVNPIPHIDPIGSILLPLLCVILPGSFFIGWAKPVPINPANFQDPRRHMALVAAAGPAMNLFLAIVSALLLSLMFTIDPTLAAYWPPQSGVGLRDDLLGMLLLPIAAMALFSVLINILLMVLNLIPVPPLDGGRILLSLLPAQSAQALRRVEPYGMLIILGLVMLEPQIQLLSTMLGVVFQLFAVTFLPQEIL